MPRKRCVDLSKCLKTKPTENIRQLSGFPDILRGIEEAFITLLGPF